MKYNNLTSNLLSIGQQIRIPTSGTNSSLFNGNPTTNELNLADRILRGEYYHPATNALWFYAPQGKDNCKATWWEQDLSGRYKSHCFYKPDPGVCVEIH